MFKRELERILNTIPPHPKPKSHLEQYPTPSTLASTLLWLAEHHYGDVSGKLVLDLGAGTGRLGLGAALLGASQVILLDIDSDALRSAWSWAKDNEVDLHVDLLVGDVNSLPLRENLSFDTVLQNPPFGVHRRGYDLLFVRTALERAKVVYSIHKESASKYVIEVVNRLGFTAETLFKDRICIPWMFEWHRKKRHCFGVVVLRFTRVCIR